MEFPISLSIRTVIIVEWQMHSEAAPELIPQVEIFYD